MSYENAARHVTTCMLATFRQRNILRTNIKHRVVTLPTKITAHRQTLDIKCQLGFEGQGLPYQQKHMPKKDTATASMRDIVSYTTIKQIYEVKYNCLAASQAAWPPGCRRRKGTHLTYLQLSRINLRQNETQQRVRLSCYPYGKLFAILYHHSR